LKRIKIFRILAVTIFLSLLVMALPTSLSLAASEDIDLDPEEGEIGEEVEISGDNFDESTATTDEFVHIYFSDEEADEGDEIDDEVENYEKVESLLWIDEDGTFDASFDVPDELTDGEDDVTVTGGTYYIYVTYYDNDEIVSVAEFTVIGEGEIEVDVEEGPVGTELEITGSGFPDDEAITIEYDSDEVDIEDGDDETDGDGEFASIIFIPESIAGEHTIRVDVNGVEAEIEFTVEPEIIVSPTSGEAGTEVTVSGTGYGKRQEVVIYFDDDGVATETTDSSGSFAAAFDLPDLAAGIYEIDVEDDDDNSDSAKFTIIAATTETEEPEPAPQPTAPQSSKTAIDISSTTAEIGSSVVVTGAGFQPGGLVTIKLDGEAVASVAAEASGIFATVFNVPVRTAGDYTLTVTDGVNTNELTFTVDVEPPAVPKPLLPQMGVELKPPVLFDWESVGSGDSPVTYTLQIAADNEFSVGKLLLEEDELLNTEYTLAKEKAASLNMYDTQLYWRIRAVGQGDNTGDWTGAGEFQVAKPFSMPGWAIYTIAGVVGLLLFLAGYFTGRRAAYYH